VTSNINYISINENFPVAGQDNDTQVFRDNFDTIKTSLSAAKTEITDLQNNTAKLNDNNDFEKNVISRAIFQDNRDQKFDGGSVSTDITIDYQNGPYQIYRFGINSNVDFLNFPGDPVFVDELTPLGVGKVTLELYGDGTSRTITFVTTGGTIFKKNAADEWSGNSIAVQSTTDPIFVEVWRHSSEKIFLKYVGQFS
jgi:hypothetical protein